MRGGSKILFSLIIIKNALLKKKRYVIMPVDKLNLEILSLCKTAGVILTYYKLNNLYIKIIFFYHQGQPI
jgi:ribosomal protein S8